MVEWKNERTVLSSPYIKLALIGDTGTLKSRTALELFNEVDGPPATVVIDNERGTHHYTDDYNFKLINTTDPIEHWEYIKAISADPQGVKCLVIDSFSLLCERIATRWAEIFLKRCVKSKGFFGEFYVIQPGDYKIINREVMNFICGLLDADMHIIITCQEKDEYAKGTMMQKIGVTFDAFRRTPYFFDTGLHIQKQGAQRKGDGVLVDSENFEVYRRKDRTNRFPYQTEFSLDNPLAKIMREKWSDRMGSEVKARELKKEYESYDTSMINKRRDEEKEEIEKMPDRNESMPFDATKDQLDALMKLREGLKINDDTWHMILEKRGKVSASHLSSQEAEELIAALESKMDKPPF